MIYSSIISYIVAVYRFIVSNRLKYILLPDLRTSISHKIRVRKTTWIYPKSNSIWSKFGRFDVIFIEIEVRIYSDQDWLEIRNDFESSLERRTRCDWDRETGKINILVFLYSSDSRVSYKLIQIVYSDWREYRRISIFWLELSVAFDSEKISIRYRIGLNIIRSVFANNLKYLSQIYCFDKYKCVSEDNMMRYDLIRLDEDGEDDRYIRKTKDRYDKISQTRNISSADSLFYLDTSMIYLNFG